MVNRRHSLVVLALFGLVWLLARGNHRHEYRAARPLLYPKSVVLVLRCRFCPDEIQSKPQSYADVSVTLDARGYLVTRTYAQEWTAGAEQHRALAMARLVRTERFLAAVDVAQREDLVPHG